MKRLLFRGVGSSMAQHLSNRKDFKKNSPCPFERGEFIACLVAVFQVFFGAIRMPEYPHQYWLFESLLAFFDSSLLGHSQTVTARQRTVLCLTNRDKDCKNKNANAYHKNLLIFSLYSVA